MTYPQSKSSKQDQQKRMGKRKQRLKGAEGAKL